MSGGSSTTRTSDAAERSPAVYFANLKEDMLLDKRLHVLKRAESSLVHRIAIDQKIMFRRFQARLRRSKIALARLWGDKDTERELRARDLHVMNTNCGQEQDDFEFLKKLKRRPCVIDDDNDGNDADKQTEKERPQSEEKVFEITDEDTEEFIRAVMENQTLPENEKNLQSLSTIGRLLDEAQLLPLKQSDIRGILTKSASSGHGRRSRASEQLVAKPESPADLKENTADRSRPFNNKDTGQQEDKPAPSLAKNRRLKDGSSKPRVQSPAVRISEQTKLHIKKNNKVRPQTSPGLSQQSPVKGKSKLTSVMPRTSSPHSPPTLSRAKTALGHAGVRDSSPDTKAKPAVGIRQGSSLDREAKRTSTPQDQTGRAKSAHSARSGSPGSRVKSGRSRPSSSVRSSSARARTPSPYKPLPGTQSLTPLPPNLSRARSVRSTGSTARKSSAQPVSLSMFEEQKKVDWVALRLEDARNTDLTPKVSAFLKTLLDLDKKERTAPKPPAEPDYLLEGPPPPDAETDPTAEVHVVEAIPEREREEEEEEAGKEELKGDRKFDYYATKMALQAASVRKERMFSLPGTPEEINMKLVGDNSIKSITMPRLYIHQPDPPQEKEEEQDDTEDEVTDNETETKDILVLE